MTREQRQIEQNPIFLASPEPFVHAVRVLLHTYALVSVFDPPERVWRPLTAALSHIAIVEQMSRANSKSNYALQQRIQESEMYVRAEWTRVLQSDPRMTLGDAIIVVGQRHSIWPLFSEFMTVKVVTEKPPWKKTCIGTSVWNF